MRKIKLIFAVMLVLAGMAMASCEKHICPAYMQKVPATNMVKPA